MRLISVFLISLSLTTAAGAVDVPSADEIAAQAERGIQNYGRGKELALRSVGTPAATTDNLFQDYVSTAQRYRDIAEQARKAQEAATKAKADGDRERTQMVQAQTANRTALSEAQSKLEALKTNTTATVEEMKTMRDGLENEIRDRSRANGDYDGQLSRLDQNENGLQAKIDGMKSDITTAERQQASAEAALRDRGFLPDGRPMTSADSDHSGAKVSGNLPSPTSSQGGVAANDAFARGEPSASQDSLNTAGGRAQGRSSTEASPFPHEDPRSKTSAGAKPGAGAPATGAGQHVANKTQVGPQRSGSAHGASADANSVEGQKIVDAAKTAAAKQLAAKAATTNTARTASDSRVTSGASGQQQTPAAGSSAAAPGTSVGTQHPAAPTRAPGSVTAGTAASTSQKRAALTKGQATRITLRMAARVKDMSQPRKAIGPIDIPLLPSQRQELANSAPADQGALAQVEQNKRVPAVAPAQR